MYPFLTVLSRSFTAVTAILHLPDNRFFQIAPTPGSLNPRVHATSRGGWLERHRSMMEINPEVYMQRLFPLFLSLLVLASCTALAQIPNPGFESWTGTDPDSWASGNVSAISLYPVTKATDAHSGSYALKGTIVPIPGTSSPMSAAIQSGAGGTGFAVTARYAGVTGYYKCSLLSGDKLGFNFIMYQGGNAIAGGAQILTASTSTWTAFSVPFTYTASGAPDKCILQFQIIGPVTGADYHLGSWYELDDLAFSGATSVGPGAPPAAYALDQNFPNPFNPATTIRYSVAHRSHVTLAVFNMLGENVATLVNDMQEPGSHDVRFDGTGLASGAYFYRLQSDGFVETRELQLLK